MIALNNPGDLGLASVPLSCIGFDFLHFAEYKYPSTLSHGQHPRPKCPLAAVGQKQTPQPGFYSDPITSFAFVKVESI
jgi:hypothetical protein